MHKGKEISINASVSIVYSQKFLMLIHTEKSIFKEYIHLCKNPIYDDLISEFELAKFLSISIVTDVALAYLL